MFPEEMTQEQVAWTLIVAFVIGMLLMVLIVNGVRRAAHNAPPLPTIHGGQAGDVLKIKPSLEINR
jgi:hypothetical protein